MSSGALDNPPYGGLKAWRDSILSELQAIPLPLARFSFLEQVSFYTRLPDCSHAEAYEIDTDNSISAHIRWR